MCLLLEFLAGLPYLTFPLPTIIFTATITMIIHLSIVTVISLSWRRTKILLRVSLFPFGASDNANLYATIVRRSRHTVGKTFKREIGDFTSFRWTQVNVCNHLFLSQIAGSHSCLIAQQRHASNATLMRSVGFWTWMKFCRAASIIDNFFLSRAFQLGHQTLSTREKTVFVG